MRSEEHLSLGHIGSYDSCQRNELVVLVLGDIDKDIRETGAHDMLVLTVDPEAVRGERVTVLSEAELLETGKQWCLDHLVTDVSSYSFRIEKTGWSDDYRWVETEPADWSWHYYVTLASDGTVESFNAQKMQ